MSLIEAIERCPEQQLESIWETDLGDRYWALVRSGIQKEAMTPSEEQKKHSVTQKLNPSVWRWLRHARCNQRRFGGHGVV